MTNRIDPAELRKLADTQLGEGPPYVKHLYEVCCALRHAADEIERLREKCDRSIDQTIRLVKEKAARLTELELAGAVVDAAEATANMFSTMPWCRGCIDSEMTCVPSAAWKNFNFGPMHDLFEILEKKRKMANG